MTRPPIDEDSYEGYDCLCCNYGICDECYEPFKDCRCYDD